MPTVEQLLARQKRAERSPFVKTFPGRRKATAPPPGPFAEARAYLEHMATNAVNPEHREMAQKALAKFN